MENNKKLSHLLIAGALTGALSAPTFAATEEPIKVGIMLNARPCKQVHSSANGSPMTTLIDETKKPINKKGGSYCTRRPAGR